MRQTLLAIAVLIMGWLSDAQAQSLTVDPESIVPLPDKLRHGDAGARRAARDGPLSGRVDRDLARRQAYPRGRARQARRAGGCGVRSKRLGVLRHESRMVAGQGDDRRRRADHDGISHLPLRLRWSGPAVPDRDHCTDPRPGSSPPGHWSAPMRPAWPRAIGRPNGRGPASACGFRTSRCGRPMAHGRSCSKRRSTRPPARARRRSRSSPTAPTSAAISSGAGRSRPRRIGFATTDLPCWR